MKEAGLDERKSWRETLFVSFENEEIMNEFYKNRIPWMIRIYMLLLMGRIGSLIHVFYVLLWGRYLRIEDQNLAQRYP